METMMDAPEPQATFDFSKKPPPPLKQRGRNDKPLCPAISWYLCTGQTFALLASWELGRPLMAEAHGHPFRSPMDSCSFKQKKKKKAN